MALESQSQKVYEKMKEEGRVTELSEKNSKRLDSALAFPEGLREEFNKKSRNSSLYARLNESGFLNMYNKQSFYKK